MPASASRRYYAASEKLLTRLGVWSNIVARRALLTTVWKSGIKTAWPYYVSDDASMGYSYLGHIVENSVIPTTHCGKSAASGGYHLMAPASYSRLPGRTTPS